MTKTKVFKRRQSIEGSLLFKNIVISNDTISFNDTFFLNIAHRSKNYLIEIPEGSTFAYTPMSEDNLVYFEVNPKNFEVRLRQTKSLNYVDIPYSTVSPVSPETDQLFFDLKSFTLKRWNKEAWVEVLGLMLGRVSGNKIVDLYTNQSQANLNIEAISSKVVRNRDLSPIILETVKGYEFLTEKELEETSYKKIDSFTFEHKLCKSVASSDIDAFTVVHRAPNYEITPASILQVNAGVALTLENVSTGELGLISERGFIENTGWAWEEPTMTPLFFDQDGKLTTESPLQKSESEIQNYVIVQKVGYIVDHKTIFFYPEHKYIL